MHWVQGQIYSPFAGVSAREWQQDPLLLTRQMVSGQASGPLRMQQGWLVSKDEAGVTGIWCAPSWQGLHSI